VKQRARTPLSSILLCVSIFFLVAWAAAMVNTSWILADLTFRLGRGSTIPGLLFGILATFGCYAAYLICGFFSRLVKYPRERSDSQSVV
jgi:peptidoglycan biosynthesis protein MviN/MurJ (putative lipid II flippase)